MGQLVVTPEVVVSKINNMTDNKSPGVDGISPKILKETVEQISTPLAHVKMGGRKINNLRYADDTTLLAESKEELLQLVTNVKEKSAQACSG